MTTYHILRRPRKRITICCTTGHYWHPASCQFSSYTPHSNTRSGGVWWSCQVCFVPSQIQTVWSCISSTFWRTLLHRARLVHAPLHPLWSSPFSLTVNFVFPSSRFCFLFIQSLLLRRLQTVCPDPPVYINVPCTRVPIPNERSLWLRDLLWLRLELMLADSR